LELPTWSLNPNSKLETPNSKLGEVFMEYAAFASFVALIVSWMALPVGNRPAVERKPSTARREMIAAKA
jgi:hypothetical protein